MPSAPHCIALSFDPKFFYQVRESIRTIKRHCRYPIDICVLALNLAPLQLEWLKAQRVILRSDYDKLPGSADLPLYAYSQWCRPYLRELFPGFEVYMWVDADIRFVHEDAFDSPHEPLSVLHLICSESQVEINGQRMRWYDLYRRLNFTE
jgi:hypothetical protein